MLRPPRRPLAYASAVSWVSTSPLAGVPISGIARVFAWTFTTFDRYVQSFCLLFCLRVTRTPGLFGEPPCERIITFISLRAGGSPKGSRPFGCLRGWHRDTHEPNQRGEKADPCGRFGDGSNPRPPVPAPAVGEALAVDAGCGDGEEVGDVHLLYSGFLSCLLVR